MITLEIIIAIVVLMILSYLIGRLGARFSKKMEDRKIKKGALDVIEGKRDNKIQLDDGRILDVHKFTTFDEHGNKIQIDLKGGVKVNNVKEEKRNEEEKISTNKKRSNKHIFRRRL